MKKTIVIYGSTTGVCQEFAKQIARKLGVSDVANVVDVNGDRVAEYDNLLLGTSTWGDGELQDDWYDGLSLMQSCDLSGKTIALFGCGDCESYGDTFVSAIGKLYDGLKDSGARFVGSVATDGYSFSDSEAVVDGRFVGLPLDDVNESDLTGDRIGAWVEEFKGSLQFAER